MPWTLEAPNPRATLPLSTGLPAAGITEPLRHVSIADLAACIPPLPAVGSLGDLLEAADRDVCAAIVKRYGCRRRGGVSAGRLRRGSAG